MKIFLAFSQSVCPLNFWDFGSSLLSLLWILFQVDCLFPLHLFIYLFYYGFLPCSFIYNIFICLFILSNLLCLMSHFHRLQVYSSSCFWYLPLVGEFGPVTCVGFLLGGTGACILVVRAWSCPWRALPCQMVFFWCVTELSTSLGSLCANGWVCFPVLFVVWQWGIQHWSLQAFGWS